MLVLSHQPNRKLEIKENAMYTGIRINNSSNNGGHWDILSAGMVVLMIVH